MRSVKYKFSFSFYLRNNGRKRKGGCRGTRHCTCNQLRVYGKNCCIEIRSIPPHTLRHLASGPRSTAFCFLSRSFSSTGATHTTACKSRELTALEAALHPLGMEGTRGYMSLPPRTIPEGHSGCFLGGLRRTNLRYP